MGSLAVQDRPAAARILRGRGSVFLTQHRARAGVPALDVCLVTGRTRLSDRRAAEILEAATRPLAHPQVRDAVEPVLLGGWTLQQLRHSALTHEAEEGTNMPTWLARSRHASVRSLERYARPGIDAVADYVARRDPQARHRT
ncbi:hypothetical protein ACFQU9_14305 [Actinomadura namibiensis]|uniref:Tyr recombinase domain-containing protein n=1 Tax=Actinomadura namibiensis TaxID=182080 RepID=A0A7W3QSC3_ACTNM|nr:hypothetical protein [Actinomadura namibiensis]MBA8957492.1 hypothetical protein [Actinomadura namibiensis]